MRKTLWLALLAVTGLVGSQGGWAQDKKEEPKIIKTKSGLEYQDLKEGTGDAAKSGDTVEVHYTGWLKENNKKFDSSVDRGKPFSFKLDNGDVIKGWDE